MLRRRLVPAERPGTWRTLWGDQDGARLGAALDDLASPSLFGGPQALVVRRAEALDNDAQERVLAALPGLGVGGTLVLVARTADQRKRLFAACQRAGAAHAFPPLTDLRAALSWAILLARERAHDIGQSAAEELVERTGADLGVLAGEIEKLSLHVGPGARIEPAQVRAVVAATRGHGVQELTDRLAARDAAGAARLLRRLVAEGEPPLRLVAFLAANLRRSLHVTELAEAGAAPDEIARRLGMPPWLVGRARGRASAADLVHALLVLGRLDLELKSSRATDAVLDAALLDITGGVRPGRGGSRDGPTRGG